MWHGSKGHGGARAAPSAPQRTLKPPSKPNSQNIAGDEHAVLQKGWEKETDIPFADPAQPLRRRGKFLSIARQRGIWPPH